MNNDSYSGSIELMFRGDKFKIKYKIILINDQYESNFACGAFLITGIKNITNIKKWCKLYIYINCTWAYATNIVQNNVITRIIIWSLTQVKA